MATIFSDNFDSYTDGSELNGQGGWSNTNTGIPEGVYITNTQSQTSPNSAKTQQNQFLIVQPITLLTGNVYTLTFSLRATSTLPWTIGFGDGVNLSGNLRRLSYFVSQTGGVVKAVAYNSTSGSDITKTATGTFTTDTWHTFTVEWDYGAKKVRVKIDSNAFSDYAVNTGANGTLSGIRFWRYNEDGVGIGDTIYFDTVSVDSVSASTGSALLRFPTGF